MVLQAACEGDCCYFFSFRFNIYIYIVNRFNNIEVYKKKTKNKNKNNSHKDSLKELILTKILQKRKINKVLLLNFVTIRVG